RCARCGIHLGQSKVQNLGVAPFGNEKVGWLDVPVNDSFGMRRIQRVGHFDAEIKQALHAHWAARYGVLEGFPLQILHGDEPPIALLADFINGADVRMIQRRRRARFAPESLQRLRIFGHSSGRNFNATKRPSCESSALYTTPMPPPPSSSRTR